MKRIVFREFTLHIRNSIEDIDFGFLIVAAISVDSRLTIPYRLDSYWTGGEIIKFSKIFILLSPGDVRYMHGTNYNLLKID